MDLFRSYLFEGLDADQMKNVETISLEMAMSEGQVIFSEGEKDGRIFILKEGAIEMTTRVENGLELPISLFRDPGDLFGVSALIPPFQYSLSSRCAETGSLLYIEQKQLAKICSQDMDIGCKISSNLAAFFLSRLKETRNQLKIHFKTILMSTRS
jgi:CRP-like cAMP-binding protein